MELNLNYPTKPRIQSTVQSDQKITYNDFFLNVFSEIKKKYTPENKFIPLSFKEKRMLLFWRNREHKPDANTISGRFNLDHYKRVKAAHNG